ncbi:MAG: heparinase II/III family protein [Rikenellaceae bacterium]|jgi:heparan-sulfate lyase|nr:heparinase II/III family protein [Rikenellaceae bacterium]
MKVLFLLPALIATALSASAMQGGEVFDRLDLEGRGLEKVKSAVAAGDTARAAVELLGYYRSRKGIALTGFDLDRVKLSDNERRMADEALDHKFFVHYGYQPSFFYGNDIDWTYWPVKDNELRWQLHRHKWFIALAKAYKTTGDGKYARAWFEQYADWMDKNPLDAALFRRKTEGAGDGTSEAAAAQEEARRAFIENMNFAWRPLETSHRLQEQLPIFAMMINSPDFTPEFLVRFLDKYQMHAEHIMRNFSVQGNHLLFEAQRLAFAGIYFPEFRGAQEWLERGIEILNEQIGKQVYADGMQFELDFGYHMAAIEIFLKALRMASANGVRDAFPPSYIATVERMIELVWNVTFPDGTQPLFGDHKATDREEMLKKFREWEQTFPKNRQIAWFASGGRRGERPPYLSHAFRTSGFYILRNGWEANSTVMVVKAGPPAFWHNQPDNGTFELWRMGRNFFPDSGCYVYSGDDKVQAEREWFRQTRVHNTLTLDGANIATDSKLICWADDGKSEVLVTSNPSCPGLTHTRTVFFVEGEFFVIVDRAEGDATGNVALHYGLCPCQPKVDLANAAIETIFADGNNIRMQLFASQPCTMEAVEGWFSPSYRSKMKRPAFSFGCSKQGAAPVEFVTVIAPGGMTGKISASLAEDRVKVSVGRRKYELAMP